jgi:hypothetical protein
MRKPFHKALSGSRWRTKRWLDHPRTIVWIILSALMIGAACVITSDISYFADPKDTPTFEHFAVFTTGNSGSPAYMDTAKVTYAVPVTTYAYYVIPHRHLPQISFTFSPTTEPMTVIVEVDNLVGNTCAYDYVARPKQKSIAWEPADDKQKNLSRLVLRVDPADWAAYEKSHPTDAGTTLSDSLRSIKVTCAVRQDVVFQRSYTQFESTFVAGTAYDKPSDSLALTKDASPLTAVQAAPDTLYDVGHILFSTPDIPTAEELLYVGGSHPEIDPESSRMVRPAEQFVLRWTATDYETSKERYLILVGTLLAFGVSSLIEALRPHLEKWKV